MNAVNKSIERNIAKRLGERRVGSNYKARSAPSPSASDSKGRG